MATYISSRRAVLIDSLLRCSDVLCGCTKGRFSADLCVANEDAMRGGRALGGSVCLNFSHQREEVVQNHVR